MIRSVRLVTLLLAALAALSACKKQLHPVSVIVVDPIRHYYPVIQGELMGVSYEVENISEHPLFIQEVQTSCGCLVPRDELPIVILPHKSGFVHLEFNTIKNTGYAHHYVYCYGNFADSSCVEMQFDTNVVPSADYNHDYEELWHRQHEDGQALRDYINGRTQLKAYYTEDPGESQSQQTMQEVKETVDRMAP